MRLNQVTVGSTDMARAEAFYGSLGLELIVRDERYLRFACPDGDSTFSVDLVDSVPDAEQVTIYFEVDELVSVCAALRQGGVVFEHPPTDMPWLWSEARLRDPDGHRLCIFHAADNRLYPPWRLPH